VPSSQSDIYADTVAVFDRRDRGFEPLTTPEVAAALDVERRTAYERLRTLVDRGVLETKKTGANSRVWWRPPDASSSTPRLAVGSPADRHGGEERDRDLARRAVATAVDGVAIVDADGAFHAVDEEFAALYGYDDPEDLRGEPWRERFHESDGIRLEEDVLASIQGGETWRGEVIGRRNDGETFTHELSLAADGDRVVCVVRDVTDRLEHERRLRDARRFNEELVEHAPFGMFRLDEELRITYENPRAEEIIGLPEGKDVSDALGADISELPPIVETGQAELFERLPEGEPIEFAFPFESIYGKEAYFTGRAVPVYRDGEFDGAILMATDISERREYERELERQREQLAALDELNDVVRGITEAVVDQSTRAEIERAVCDRLADSDSYRYAWIAAIESDFELDLRTVVGTDDVPVASESPIGSGSVGAAVRTREMQVTRHALEADAESVRDRAREFDYRASAVIPIAHQGVLYGVLGVYSTRPDAFAEAEREVIGQLGDVVGHAIAAIDRKRALLGDEVLEIEVRVPTIFQPSEGSSVPDGTLEFDRLTPIRGGEFLAYGTASGDATSDVDGLADQFAYWQDVWTFDATETAVRFEAHLSDAPLAAIVADRGGRFQSARIVDDTYHATVQFPPGTDVRRVIEAVQPTYPDLELVRQQQVTRTEPSARSFRDIFGDVLTERQRVALEAGYFGGFFDWPRHRSGESIAESLGITASTFHQHIRRAQKKLLDEFFAD
jgi:PAS domain S-box-containing protein